MTVARVTNLISQIFPSNPTEGSSGPVLVIVWFGLIETVVRERSERGSTPFYSADVMSAVSHIQLACPKAAVVLMSPPAITAPADHNDPAYANTSETAKFAKGVGIPFVDVYSAMQNAAYDISPSSLATGLEKLSVDGARLTPEGHAVGCQWTIVTDLSDVSSTGRPQSLDGSNRSQAPTSNA